MWRLASSLFLFLKILTPLISALYAIQKTLAFLVLFYTKIYIMFRQTFLTSARGISSSVRVSTQASASRVQNFQFLAPVQLFQVTQRSIARWYSEDSKSISENKGKEGEAKDAATTAESEDPTAALRKELEDKKKEMAEWKVSISHPLSRIFSSWYIYSN